MFFRALAAVVLVAATATSALAQSASEPPRERPRSFVAADVFSLEYADSPRISPDGRRIAAEFKDGLLMVRLPKCEAKKPRQIEVRVS